MKGYFSLSMHHKVDIIFLKQIFVDKLGVRSPLTTVQPCFFASCAMSIAPGNSLESEVIPTISACCLKSMPSTFSSITAVSHSGGGQGSHLQESEIRQAKIKIASEKALCGKGGD